MLSIRTRKTTRLVLAGAAVVLALGVAAPAGAAQSGENYPGGESTFRDECRMAGGRFYRDADSGAIRCRFDNGTVIMCDKGARNCKTYEAKLFQPQGSTMYTGPVAVASR